MSAIKLYTSAPQKPTTKFEVRLAKRSTTIVVSIALLTILKKRSPTSKTKMINQKTV